MLCTYSLILSILDDDRLLRQQALGLLICLYTVFRLRDNKTLALFKTCVRPTFFPHESITAMTD